MVTHTMMLRAGCALLAGTTVLTGCDNSPMREPIADEIVVMRPSSGADWTMSYHIRYVDTGSDGTVDQVVKMDGRKVIEDRVREGSAPYFDQHNYSGMRRTMLEGEAARLDEEYARLDGLLSRVLGE